MSAYAGIGSRSTPAAIRAFIIEVAYVQRAAGITLRSGHAPGADQAFERGALGHAEIFRPWAGFEGKVPTHPRAVVFDEPTDAALELTARYHPYWSACDRPARLLHARNAHQVLGRDLDDPVTRVICWTRDGSLDGSAAGQSGGTGQALRIAHAHDIEVINLRRPEHIAAMHAEMWNGDGVLRGGDGAAAA